MLSQTHRARLQRAIKAATLSTCRQKHGVIITNGSRVVAVGVNTERNHPDIVTDPKHESSVHAEMNAIKQVLMVGYDYSNLMLYSARVNNNGVSMLAKPCDACSEHIWGLGFKAVYHT